MSRSRASSTSRSSALSPSSRASASTAGSNISGSTVSPSTAGPSTAGSSVGASRISGISNVDLGPMGVQERQNEIEEVVATSLKDRKILAIKMVGVGFINIPPGIVRQKLVLSIILYLLFSVNLLVLGVLLYGTHKALNDYCYNPVDPDAMSRATEGQPYNCMPVTSDGLIPTFGGQAMIYMFQSGAAIHAMALAVGVFGTMYLNIFCVLIFMIMYLGSYTLMLASLALEFFFGKFSFLKVF